MLHVRANRYGSLLNLFFISKSFGLYNILDFHTINVALDMPSSTMLSMQCQTQLRWIWLARAVNSDTLSFGVTLYQSTASIMWHCSFTAIRFTLRWHCFIMPLLEGTCAQWKCNQTPSIDLENPWRASCKMLCHYQWVSQLVCQHLQNRPSKWLMTLAASCLKWRQMKNWIAPQSVSDK